MSLGRDLEEGGRTREASAEELPGPATRSQRKPRAPDWVRNFRADWEAMLREQHPLRAHHDTAGLAVRFMLEMLPPSIHADAMQAIGAGATLILESRWSGSEQRPQFAVVIANANGSRMQIAHINLTTSPEATQA